MAISTAITTLNYKATEVGTYAKLVDIINYPDLGSSPSKLDTTDLSQPTFKTSILGLQEMPDLTFECNYDETAFTTLKSLEGDTLYFQLAFGASDGTFTWTGQLSVYANGAGVDEVRKMTVTVSTATPITFA